MPRNVFSMVGDRKLSSTLSFDVGAKNEETIKQTDALRLYPTKGWHQNKAFYSNCENYWNCSSFTSGL